MTTNSSPPRRRPLPGFARNTKQERTASHDNIAFYLRVVGPVDVLGNGDRSLLDLLRLDQFLAGLLVTLDMHEKRKNERGRKKRRKKAHERGRSEEETGTQKSKTTSRPTETLMKKKGNILVEGLPCDRFCGVNMYSPMFFVSTPPLLLILTSFSHLSSLHL